MFRYCRDCNRITWHRWVGNKQYCSVCGRVYAVQERLL